MAFDMDGTLLAPDGNVPDINARALRECEARGIYLAFCSGRSHEVLRRIARGIGVDPIIASSNGARIDAGCDGPTLFERTLDIEKSRRILAAMRSEDVYFMTYTRGHTYTANRDAEIYDKKHHHAPGILDYAGARYEIVADERRLETEGIIGATKFVAYGADNDPRFERIRARLNGVDVAIASSWRDNIEVMQPGADKGAAIKFIAEYAGVARENIMAFGDNDNDLPMLNYAGWSVAMSSGEACAKAAARLIAPDCALGGVGRFIFDAVLS